VIGPRLVSLLIRLLPGWFRERFGEEMLSTYLDQRDAARRTSRHAAFRYTLGTLKDLIVTVPVMHLAARRRRVSSQFPLHQPQPMQNLASELRHVARSLTKQPGFAVVAILTLALGIGANTAVFSVLNSVVLAPLPYDHPGELVRLYTASRQEPDQRQFLTVPDFLEVREQSGAFADLGTLNTYRESGTDLTPPGGEPRRIRVGEVSAGYFAALRATPQLGRAFTADEEHPDVPHVVLSDRLWHEVANGDRSIIGRTIPLNGRDYVVIGVMRPTFRDFAGEDVAAWLPVNLERGGDNTRNNHFLSAIGRLKPGVSIAAAQARVSAVMAHLAVEFPSPNRDRTMRVLPLLDDTVGDSRTSVYVLMGAAGLVLLIACLNVANLFLAKSLGQSRELAVRTALGANRIRLIGQRLIESVVVAMVGGIAGSLVAFWGVKLLLAMSPASLPRAEEVGFDPRLLAFALATTALTGLLFGAAPAWRASRVDPTHALHEGSRGNTGGRGGRRVRDVLVAGQVAVALVLLVGAGLLIKSFVALQRVELGFDSDHVETFEVHLPEARYAAAASRVRFHEAFGRTLAELPGVERVGAVSWLPTNGNFHQWGYGYRDSTGADQYYGNTETRVVERDYFAALRIPLISGRTFVPTDLLDSNGVALISRSLAERIYGQHDPLGERFQTGGREFRVIGVVGDVANQADGARVPMIYLSHLQVAGDRNWSLTYVVRTAGPPEAMTGSARAALAAIDPALVLYRPRPLDDVVVGHRARQRFTLFLMGAFATVALTLAAVGVYGVLSYAVTQRVHEIGVRMALGARPGQVRAVVLRHGAMIGASGMAVGAVAAAGLSQVLRTLVFRVSPREPVIFGAVALVLGAVVLLAGYVPARRATRVEPLEALRGD
jgi:putative ABC transport system permease protein